MKGLKIMTQDELIRLYDIGILTRELLKELEDFVDNIETDDIYEIVEYYQNALIHFSKIFVEKMKEKLDN